MGGRAGGGSASNSRGGNTGFGSKSKSASSKGSRKSNPFSASAAMKLMCIDKNAAKLLKSGMFGF